MIHRRATSRPPGIGATNRIPCRAWAALRDDKVSYANEW